MIKERDNEEKVRKSEERFRLLAENTRDFIIILQLKPFKYECISPVIVNNHIVAWQIISRDITQRKKDEVRRRLGKITVPTEYLSKPGILPKWNSVSLRIIR